MTDYIATDTELTSVANAIRAKRGTNAQLSFPTEFVSAINAISGGGDKAEPNDVMFIDCDGTILYSYSASDFSQLTEMPANPDRTSEGLIAEGWNYTLSQAKTEVSSMGYLVIGQTYQTADGKTHIFIDLDKTSVDNGQLFTLGFSQQNVDTSESEESYYALIDWGDNATTVAWDDTYSTYSHTYAHGGKYEITVTNGIGSIVCFGKSGGYDSMVGSFANAYYYYRRYAPYKIHIGDNVKINDYCCYYFNNLQAVTIPSDIQYIGPRCFYDCSSLKGLVFPPSTLKFSDVPTYCCYECTSLRNVSTGYQVGVGQCAFQNCYSLNYISLSDSCTASYAGQNSSFYNCNSLKRIAIPTGKTTIPQACFQYCYSLNSVTIPASVTSISSNALSNCTGINAYHMKSTTPPSLSSTSAIYCSPYCHIYVPRSTNQTVLNTYKTASNWSTYASYMQEEPA